MDAAKENFLLELAAKNGGKLTPAGTVEAARDPNCPIHSDFEWDNDIAGDKYRLDQARKMITSIRVTIIEHPREVLTVGVRVLSPDEVEIVRQKRSVPVFVRDPDKAPNEQGYTSVHNLVTHEDSARAVMRNEIGRVRAHLDRARAFADYFGMTSELQVITAQVLSLSERIDTAQYQSPDQDGDEAA